MRDPLPDETSSPQLSTIGVDAIGWEADPSVEAPVDQSRVRRTGRRLGAHRPAVVFAAVLAVSFVYLVRVTSYRWFYNDEWSFVLGQPESGLGKWFSPHNEHWSTMPLMLYRFNWKLFGLNTYLPYVVSSILSHLLVCALLWVVMRRAHVSGWIATATATAFVLYGPGQANVVQAFQVSLTASIVFGLVQLLLVDHDGPIDRRDALALLAGVLGLMSSGISLTMISVVGLAVLIRRGWRPALLQTVPLAAIFVTWYSIERPRSTPLPPVQDMASFTWTGVSTALTHVGHFQIVGVALVILLVAGLFLAWSPLSVATFRHRAGAPVALLAGSVLFYAITAVGRADYGDEFAELSRYLYISACLAIPAFGVAAEAVSSRWRRLTPVVLALLLIGVPWNAADFSSTSEWNQGGYDEAYFVRERQLVSEVAYSPDLREVPPGARPLSPIIKAVGLNARNILDAKIEGKIPRPDPAAPKEIAPTARLLIGVSQTGYPRPPTCKTVTGDLEVEPARGDIFGVDGPVRITSRSGDRPVSRTLAYTPTKFGPYTLNTLSITLDDLELTVSPPAGATSFLWCH